MLLEELVGKVVRLLWCDIPYVGFFLTIDTGKYIVLTDCKRYSNLTLCFKNSINTTDQQVDFIRLPKTEIRWISILWQDFFQVRAEFNSCDQRNFGNLFQVYHCLSCFKPKSMIPIKREGAAMFTLVGNQDVALPDNFLVMQAFIDSLPKHCLRCAGGNLTTINGRCLNPLDPVIVPMHQNNPQFQQGPQFINAHLMEGIPQGLNLNLPPILPYLAVNNNYAVPPPFQGYFGNNVRVNPFQYYNSENMLPRVVQAFPNTMHVDTGNLNMPNPMNGYPNATNQNNNQMEFPPPWHFPYPNSNGFKRDDSEENNEKINDHDKQDNKMEGEEDKTEDEKGTEPEDDEYKKTEDEKDAKSDVMLPKVH